MNRMLTFCFFILLGGCSTAPVRTVSEVPKDFQFNMHQYDPQQTYSIYLRQPDGKITVQPGFIRKSAVPGHVSIVSLSEQNYITSDVPLEQIVYVSTEIGQQKDSTGRNNTALIVVGAALLAGLIAAALFVGNQ